MTIDIDSIETLAKKDPLFVGERNMFLPPFMPASPLTPAFEFPDLMHARGLILENIEGFELDESGDLVNAPFFRAVPSLFNLEFTAPYGYSACCPNLQDFAMGAVFQHLPKTLARMEGPDNDFVLPTADQLQALEAFLLSNRSPADGNFKIRGPNNVLSTSEDPIAVDTTRREVRGRDVFLRVGCASCHDRTGVFDGGNRDTGVESLEASNPLSFSTPTTDLGNGNGAFQTPQLFGMKKQHFFHAGAIGNNVNQIDMETQRFSNLRDAVAFYVSDAFTNSPTGGQVRDMTEVEIREIAAFLEAISDL